MAAHELVKVVETLRPDALLIDDIQESDADFLELLESLRVGVTFLTYMADRPLDPNEPGSLYVPGLRPGRVDHIEYIGNPDVEKRRLILDAMGIRVTSRAGASEEEFTAFVEALAGLTPAYYGRAVKGWTKHNSDWRKRLRHLRACAPASESSPDEPRDDDEGCDEDAESWTED